MKKGDKYMTIALYTTWIVHFLAIIHILLTEAHRHCIFSILSVLSIAILGIIAFISKNK